ncbi:GNAT family N-acetyltransferase [Pseudonocardia xinjiangensis]|uniref:GNAT family N-acetyltransferase n=1 Tax=Pseudonocardia xinjiangensis TaxID=75289 RepID=UPI003D8B6AE3
MFTTVARAPLPEDYVRLRASVGWPSPDVEACARALGATVFGLTAHDEAGRAVGMGRVIGDGLYLVLVDVVVEPAVQGQGLGARIMDELTGWATASGATHVALAADADVAPFYARWGFVQESTAYLRLRGRNRPVQATGQQAAPAGATTCCPSAAQVG